MEDIVITDLCKSFGGRKVLDRFCAVLPAGEVTGLMAPSGAGKTTLLRILMGLEQADGGSITGLSGLRISAVFQEDRLCLSLTPSQNLRLVNPDLTEGEARAALRQVGLSDEQKTEALSGGMRRRVAILRALLAPSDLLLLDEPFRSLDDATRRLVMEDVKARIGSRTVLLVTHDPGELAGVRTCLTL